MSLVIRKILRGKHRKLVGYFAAEQNSFATFRIGFSKLNLKKDKLNRQYGINLAKERCKANLLDIPFSIWDDSCKFENGLPHTREFYGLSHDSDQILTMKK